jgi:hypothetical protein
MRGRWQPSRACWKAGGSINHDSATERGFAVNALILLIFERGLALPQGNADASQP